MYLVISLIMQVFCCCCCCFQGNYKFRCPALLDGTKQCNKEWSYQEVRRLADLTVEEMQHFEESMARLALADHCECKTDVERKDLSNLCVQCVVCTADQKKTYQFCWQCLKPWKGAGLRSDRCDNDGCENKDLQLMQTCKTISLPEVEGVTSCPAIRLCPTCGMRVEHTTEYCKNINCPRCKMEFCFVCLELKLLLLWFFLLYPSPIFESVTLSGAVLASGLPILLIYLMCTSKLPLVQRRREYADISLRKMDGVHTQPRFFFSDRGQLKIPSHSVANSSVRKTAFGCPKSC
uniref:RING-type domain-containing protein n=1 Tax=Pundamilia nyererei TaxID=303518 RepID=A0A3B4F1N2_9CICH